MNMMLGVRRFINADEAMFLGASGTVLGYNLYAYCENNPVNYADNTGYVATNVIGAVIAGVIGAVGLLVGVTAVAIGYFIGPYVAKAWSVWSSKLSGLIKGTFKSIA